MELFEDMGRRPMVLIRFNCDAYSIDGTKYPSLFKTNRKIGTPCITNKDAFNNRIEFLVKTIEKYIETVPEKEITTEYLFYSN